MCLFLFICIIDIKGQHKYLYFFHFSTSDVSKETLIILDKTDDFSLIIDNRELFLLDQSITDNPDTKVQTYDHVKFTISKSKVAQVLLLITQERCV